MKKAINFKLLLISFITATVLVSCNEDVTVINENEITVDVFRESINLDLIEFSANATYAQLQNIGLYARYGYILPDTFSDESISGGDPNFIASYLFRLTPSLPQTTEYWNNCYKGISACNFVLSNEETMMEGLEKDDIDYSLADVNDALGQARFLRGIYYFLLVKRYGGVPLNLQVFEVAPNLPRATKEEVWDVIIDDFSFASENLYDKGLTEVGRATKGAALGMLGKAHLFNEQYADAKVALDKITDYTLLPIEDYDDNFNESGEFNDESMFEVVFSGDVDGSQWAGTGAGLNEVTFHAQEYAGWGNALPSEKMIDEFEENDPRFKSAILLSGDPVGNDGTSTWTERAKTWKKFSQLYENTSTVENGTTNVRFLRYADVVLMQAEVEHKLGNNSGAINFLNEIRTRAEMPLYGTPEMDAAGFPVSTPDEVFSVIVHERMVELCAEQHRYDDLVRWNLDAQEIGIDEAGTDRGYDPNVDRLMPIPQIEIDTNLEMDESDQNPGF